MTPRLCRQRGLNGTEKNREDVCAGQRFTQMHILRATCRMCLWECSRAATPLIEDGSQATALQADALPRVSYVAKFSEPIHIVADDFA